MAFENPFLKPSATRQSALRYLFSDSPDSTTQNTSNNSYSIVDNAMGVSNAKAEFEAFVLNAGGEGGEGGENSGQGPLGIGKATNAIHAKAFQAFVMGYLSGGLPGAIKGGMQSLAKGTASFLSDVNSTDDPLRAWAIAQGWAPVPVVDMSTPPAAFTSPVAGEVNSGTSFQPANPNGMFSETPAANSGAVTSPVDMSVGSPSTPIAPMAQSFPVNMSLPPTTPIAPAFNNSSNAAATAQAAANAAANAAAVAAAQSSGSAPSLGGDLGTGASDAAGFGGFGGVW